MAIPLLFLQDVPVRGWTGRIVRVEYSFRLCEWCGTQITDRRRTRCCSAACNEKFWNRVREQERAAAGVRPQTFWYAFRSAALERDRHACQRCGRTKNDLPSYHDTIEVHHILPVSEGGTSEPDNLICLCTACHKAVHTERRLSNRPGTPSPAERPVPADQTTLSAF